MLRRRIEVVLDDLARQRPDELHAVQLHEQAVAQVSGADPGRLKVADDGDGLACTVTYQARRAASASIEAELDALVGRIDADYDGLS